MYSLICIDYFMCHFNVTIFHPVPFASYFSVFLHLSPCLISTVPASSIFRFQFFFSFTRLPNLSFYYLYFRFFCRLLLSVFLSLCSFYFDCKKRRSSVPQAKLHTAWLATTYHHREQIAFRIALV